MSRGCSPQKIWDLLNIEDRSHIYLRKGTFSQAPFDVLMIVWAPGAAPADNSFGVYQHFRERDTPITYTFPSKSWYLYELE